MNTIIPPTGEVPRGECNHRLAGIREHRCPQCQGTLRRCCQSVIGYQHAEFCQAMKQSVAQVVDMTAVSD